MATMDVLKPIRLFIMDVDGVMTDGRIWLDGDGEWRRLFSVLDGIGIRRLMEAGYQTGVITGANSEDVRKRMQFLGIHHFYENIKYKEAFFEEILKNENLDANQVAYIGDDIFDVPLIKSAGFGATVPGGVDEALEVADYVTQKPGGFGAVREVCDLILRYGALSE